MVDEAFISRAKCMYIGYPDERTRYSILLLAIEEMISVKLLNNEEHLLSYETQTLCSLPRRPSSNSCNSLLLELAQKSHGNSCRLLKGLLVEGYGVSIYCHDYNPLYGGEPPLSLKTFLCNLLEVLTQTKQDSVSFV